MKTLPWQILLTGFFIGIIASGIILIVTRQPHGSPIELIPVTTPMVISVDVSGAVKNSGLYKIPSNSRLVDAIQAAGGLDERADKNRINLAAKLQDGQKILIPEVAVSINSQYGNVNSGNSVSGTKPTPSLLKPININSASIDELQLLPGIGLIRAQQIIDYRSKIGKFTKLEQLLDIPGIGQSTLEHIQPYLILDDLP